MTEDLNELHEHAQHGALEPGLAPVTVTMAIFAVLVAASSLLGHRAHTEELLHQTKSTDQWAYYQAKDIRRRSYELFLDEMAVFSLQNSEQITKIREKYRREVERYSKEQTEIEAQAKEAEQEVSLEQRGADRFDLGEVLLEAALAICAIALLTRKRMFWKFGMTLLLAGLLIAAAVFLVR